MITETAYEAGMALPCHSHGSSHLAILLEGAYLERVSDRVYLCLPGDAVNYEADVQHDNLFGDRAGRCLNLEFQNDEAPQICRKDQSYVPSEVRSLLASSGCSIGIQAPVVARQARERLCESPMLSLGPLAEELAVHPNYLAKAFRRSYGLSVAQFAKLQRIRRAAGLLIETEQSVGEIAHELGFFDQSHFTNTLHQITGFSPASLRRIAHA